MIVVEDDIHCERAGRFLTFEDAITELKRCARVPWDRPPNRAPCTTWRTCGREYHVLEYDTSHAPWKLLRNVAVLNVSVNGIEWVDDFEHTWLAAGE